MSFFKKKTFDSVFDAGNASGLNKTLSAFDLILLGLGAIVGTGVFALTGLVAAQHAGPAVMLSYLIAGCTCIFVALVYTELATMLPTSGSVYTYSYVAFGEVFAWLIGSIIIVELGFASSAVAGSWSSYIQGILSSAGYQLPEAFRGSPAEGGIFNLPAFLVVIFVGAMLYLGTKDSKRLNNILVFIKMAAIFIFIFFAAPHFDATNWDDFMPKGVHGVVYGSGILFFAFTGFAILASTAEECKNPKRDLVIGIIGSLLLATFIYIIVAALATGIVPYGELDTASPLAHALKLNGSTIGSALVATGAVAGMTTVIMMNIYGQSRIFYVIARDGLMPKAMSKLHHKYDSPHITIIIFTTVIAVMAAFFPYGILAQLSSMSALIDYIAVAIIVMMFRVQMPNVNRPFKCPGVFVISPVAILASLILLFNQVFDQNNNLLLSGKIMIYWFVVMFMIYMLKVIVFDKIRKID